MPRTPIFKDYENKLIGLNDQLCYYLFLQEEFKNSLRQVSNKDKELFTTNLYSKNSYSKKINVKIKDISNFQKSNEYLIYGSTFSTSYEFFANYLEVSASIINKMNNMSNIILNRNGKLEENYNEFLNKLNFKKLDPELIKTIYFLRCKRNNFIHRNVEIHSDLKNFIKTEGKKIKKYWKKKNLKLLYLTFEEENIDEFSEGLTIELLKLLKILMEYIDTHIINQSDSRNIISYYLRINMPTKEEKNGLTPKKLAKKYVTRIYIDYNLKINANDVEEVIKNM